MKTSKEIVRTNSASPGKRRKNLPKRIPEVPAALQKQVRALNQPYVVADVKVVAEKHGINIDYLIEKIKEQAEAVLVIEEPLQVPLLDEMDIPITMKQTIEGREVEIPLVTTKKQYNTDTGRVETVTIIRTVPNLKARQWAIDTLTKLLIAPMAKETNLNVSMNKAEASRIEEASNFVKENPKLKEQLLALVMSPDFDEGAIEADFEEI